MEVEGFIKENMDAVVRNIEGMDSSHIHVKGIYYYWSLSTLHGVSDIKVLGPTVEKLLPPYLMVEGLA